MKNPDYNSVSKCWGGYLNEIPLPHIRKFSPESPLIRQVTVDTSSWRDVGQSDAQHVFVHVIIEANPIWNSEKNWWQEARDDDESCAVRDIQAKVLYDDPNRDKTITAFVKEQLKKYFPAGDYVLKYREKQIKSPKKWIYKQDGD